MDDAGVRALDKARAAGLALLREHALVAGEPVPAGRDRFDVDDPAERIILGGVPKLSRDQVERAVAAAAAGAPGWARTNQAKRGEVLRRWAALIDEHADGLAALMALENGKPFEEARGEVAYANSFVKWFAGEAERLHGDTVDTSTGQTVLVFREPVGPVAAITPWNFPAAMITRKVAPAFAAGCTVVLKPAHQTPFTAIALAELALRAGIPPEAFSVVTGENEVVGPALTGSPLIRKLSFTGSTPVGRRLMAECAPTLKKLSMELGGAAPLVVFGDMDLETAVRETVRAKFRNSGQTCVCPNRIYVQRNLHDRFVEALAAAVAALKVGGPFEPEVKVGPLIDAKGVDKVERHVGLARESGARLLTGGRRHARGPLFFEPTVLDGGDDVLFGCEETFGPVVPVFTFDTEAEALERCNASDYGLASYVFTRDLDRAVRFARGLEAGMVGVNTGLFSNAAAPFGGIKQSGFGREGSRHGLDEYLTVKAVTLGVR